MVSLPDRPAPRTLTALGTRLVIGLATAWAAVSLTFFALRIGGGDPVASLLAQGLATPAQAQALRYQLGLDQPLLTQYLRFLGDLVRGRLGVSLYTSQPVGVVVAEQLPPTAQLASLGLMLAVAFGLTLGVTAACRERGLIGRASDGLAGLATALPVAFTGILAILVSGLMRDILAPPAWTVARRLLLPALVLGFASSGAIARVVQFGLRESLRAPYVLAARARGLPPGPRLLWHALRPVLPPAVSLSALEAAYLFGGTVVTETVFSRPGLGRLLVGSILQGDYPVAQGIVVLAALVYTATQVLADAAAVLLDPRLRRHTP
ncbi:MAG: ABC transporter permease [Chloroflexota bacterium]